MIITNEKIEVTYEMMSQSNMTRGYQFGIPVDLNDFNKGLRWKTMAELQDSDFDTIEEYFINKKSTAHNG